MILSLRQLLQIVTFWSKQQGQNMAFEISCNTEQEQKPLTATLTLAIIALSLLTLDRYYHIKLANRIG